MVLFTPRNTSGYTIPTTGQNLYVSPTGTTANTGLSASSPTTIAKALSLANGVKTTVLFADGVYDDVVTINKANVTFQAMPNTHPTIDGSEVITGFALEGVNYVKYGYNYTFPTAPTPDERDTTTDFRKAANLYQLWLNETYLDQVQNLSELAPGKFYFEEGATPAQNKLMIRDNPTGKTVRGVARNVGVKATGNVANNFIIKGINVIRHANANIWASGNAANVQIIDCVADLASYFGIWADTNGIIVRNCKANDCGKNGIKGGFWKDNCIFEDNEVLRPNKRRFNAAWGAAAMKMMSGTNNIYRRNTFGGSLKCPALWLDTDNFNNEVYENEFVGSNIGFFNEISYKVHVVNNIFRNNNVGVLVAASEETIVENNDFIDNNIDIYLKDDNRVSTNDNHRVTALNEAWVTRNNVIRNNYHKGTLQKVYETTVLPAITSSSTYVSRLENNQFVNPNIFAKWSGVAKDKLYTTLAAFKADFPTLQAQSVEVATAPTTRLAAKPVHDAVVLRILGGTQPTVVGAKITSTTPPPPPPYVPPTEAEYRAIMLEIDRMEGRIATLEDEVYISDVEIGRLNGLVTTLRAEKTALQGQIAPLQAQITALQADKTALQADKTTLQAQVTSLQSDKTALQNEVSALQADKTALNGQVLTLQAEIATLQAEIVRISDMLENQPNRDEEVAALNAEIASLTDKLNQIRAILA